MLACGPNLRAIEIGNQDLWGAPALHGGVAFKRITLGSGACADVVVAHWVNDEVVGMA